MNDLQRTSNLGDISFGAPPDIEILNKPFGFYEYVDLSPDASDSELRKKYRELALKYHPDRNPEDKGAESIFKEISNIFDTLLDDGGELGPEHSKKDIMILCLH